MAIQWSLVIFTLFVCLTSGLLGGTSFLALRGKGGKMFMPGTIASLVLLVVGGLGAFTHLKHWERIFNGFGHLSSGITQELIGCVVLFVAIVAWFLALRRRKKPGTPLTMTTHPVHIDSLMQFALAGEGAPALWLALVCTVIALACGLVAGRREGSGKALAVVAVIAALAASVLFRVLIYQLGFSLTILY